MPARTHVGVEAGREQNGVLRAVERADARLQLLVQVLRVWWVRCALNVSGPLLYPAGHTWPRCSGSSDTARWSQANHKHGQLEHVEHGPLACVPQMKRTLLRPKPCVLMASTAAAATAGWLDRPR